MHAGKYLPAKMDHVEKQPTLQKTFIALVGKKEEK
jgi:hypothetical protein